MERDYRIALYALGLSAVLLVAAGAVVASGFAPGATPAPTQSDDDPTNGTDAVRFDRESDQQYDVTVTASDNGTVTFASATSGCGGVVAVNASDADRTDVQVDGTTVTLIEEHGGETFDGISRERVAELVWDATSDRAELDEYDRVTVRVNQYYESIDRERPLDTAGVTVRPYEDCLPTVRGEIDLAGEDVTVITTLPPLDDIELRITDGLGVLNDDERRLIEELVAADEEASYNVQQQFNDPERLNATVLEATNDDLVDVRLTTAGSDGSAVIVTIDLNDETVVRSYATLELDADDVVMFGEGENETVSMDGGGTVTFETDEDT
ncbi:hypothetical protein ACFQMF_13835 [Halorubrum rutilum]|uniref:DUF2092 domain-containing protein n=1 Tax=Halorubrum rutilum TaxID=1364933 RepID=A0ABD6AN15_9EURY|nr:hypothetical protein [Halorubrum rutilum]